jgi:tetratricopeptide (TPR) repeat protein
MAEPATPVERIEAGLTAAGTLREAGAYAPAEEILRETVSLADQTCGPASIAAAETRNELGILLKAAGQYEPARARYLEALAIYGRHPGPAHAEAVATLYHNLAGIDLVRGEPAQAAEWARKGLALRRDLVGDDDLLVLLDEGNLAPILVVLGAYDEAETLLVRLHERLVAKLGPNDYEVAVALTNLGGLAAHRGQWSAAEAYLNQALRIKTDLIGADHPDLLRTLVNLSVVTEHLGQTDGAGQAHRRALGIARAHLSPEHPLRRTLENW